MQKPFRLDEIRGLELAAELVALLIGRLIWSGAIGEIAVRFDLRNKPLFSSPPMKWDNTGFGEKAYSAAKIAAVVDLLVSEGVAPHDALKGADLSFEALHVASTRISRNQLI